MFETMPTYCSIVCVYIYCISIEYIVSAIITIATIWEILIYTVLAEHHIVLGYPTATTAQTRYFLAYMKMYIA